MEVHRIQTASLDHVPSAVEGELCFLAGFSTIANKLILEYIRSETKTRMTELERLGPRLLEFFIEDDLTTLCHRRWKGVTLSSKCVNLRLGSLYKVLKTVEAGRVNQPFQYTVGGYAAALKVVVMQSIDWDHDQCIAKLRWMEDIHDISRRTVPIGDKSKLATLQTTVLTAIGRTAVYRMIVSGQIESSCLSHPGVECIRPTHLTFLHRHTKPSYNTC